MSDVSALASAAAEYAPERRSRRRYAIELGILYRVAARHRTPLVGRGSTLNLSSRGILFRADGSFQRGAMIQLALAWPFSLDETPLQLIVRGRVVRNDAQGTAVEIHRHEFRTCKSKPDADRRDRRTP